MASVPGAVVADEGNGGPGPDRVAEAFGYVVAYLCPGFIGLWTISRFVDTLGNWLSDAAAHSTSFGGFLLLVLASLSLGVFISGVRVLVFENLVFKAERFKDCEMPSVDVRRRTSGAFESVYLDLRESYFRFWQFYSHTLVVLPFAVGAWLWKEWPGPGWAALTVLAATVVGYVLFRNALFSRRRYCVKIAQLLGLTES